MTKQNLLIICGGPSAEHNISLVSAKSICQNINLEKYNVRVIALNDKYTFYELSTENLNKTFLDSPIQVEKVGKKVYLVPGENKIQLLDSNFQIRFSSKIIFPIIHGPGGEDGKLQGLLELSGVAFVGCGTTSSAICMDKDYCKKILKANQVPVSEYFVFKKNDSKKSAIDKINSSFGFPVFIKPANMGSSVGVHKCLSKIQLSKCLEDALKYDSKILIEENILGDEIEVAVIGNDKPRSSDPGRYKIKSDFYDFEAKYLSAKEDTKYYIPAYENKSLNKRIKYLAEKTYKALSCKGLARVDFFKTENNILIVNEINTLPGFTPISMFPMLWKNEGFDFTKLIDELIQYALDNH